MLDEVIWKTSFGIVPVRQVSLPHSFIISHNDVFNGPKTARSNGWQK